MIQFKAEFLNAFVAKNSIQTVLEFGCGDGNQLKIAKYPNYIGLDVSKTAINICHQLFPNDKTKSF
jgi:cyclopropane fatty-acyl-phospholipid synthase-like methyltransferase